MTESYHHLLTGNLRFGNTIADICRNEFSCEPEQIHEQVVLAPWWQPTLLTPYGVTIEQLSDAHEGVWDLSLDGRRFTYIRTGIGAPVVIDAVFALSGSPCRSILFLGSVGGLKPEIRIGDIVIPEYSVCGDGACRYVTTGSARENDCFGERYAPDRAAFDALCAIAAEVTARAGTSWHIGRAFSVDTIFAQFAHIDEILAMGCNCIEMETAALFKASAACGIRAGALFNVSDNTVTKQSLYSGRSDTEIEYQRQTRRSILARIALRALGAEMDE